MSVKVCDRSHGKFETLASAIELETHLIMLVYGNANAYLVILFTK